MRTFKKEFLQALAWGDPSNSVIHETRITKVTRWSVWYTQVFEIEGKFYRTNFSKGATEMQSEEPYEYEPEDIECQEVKPVEKVVTVYEDVQASA